MRRISACQSMPAIPWLARRVEVRFAWGWLGLLRDVGTYLTCHRCARLRWGSVVVFLGRLCQIVGNSSIQDKGVQHDGGCLLSRSAIGVQHGEPIRAAHRW